MKTFITADQHFNDANKNLIKNRGFTNKKEMEADIIKRWNEVVGPQDLVYIIGDFIRYEKPKKIYTEANKILEKLNGELIFIRGNHECIEYWYSLNLAGYECYDKLHIHVNDVRVELVHDPAHSSYQSKSVQLILHGHLHGQKSELTHKSPYAYKFMDIGWDNYLKPLELKSIIK